jgi:hypothetical protein
MAAMLGVVAAACPMTTPPAAVLPTPAVIDAINTIGLVDFPNTYLNAKVTAPHTVTIYRTVHDPAFIHALRAIDGLAGYRIDEQRVTHSFAALEVLTRRLARDLTDIVASGLNLVVWAPDVHTDTVSVTLAHSSGDTGATLSTTAVAAATKALAARYGAGQISVSPVVRSYPTEQKGRDADAKPYFAGNGYAATTSTGVEACTSGFAVEDAHAHRPYMLSAGHCGRIGDTTTLGTVSKRYVTAGWDFEAIDAGERPGTGAANVWYGETGTSVSYRVIGAEIPAIGSKVTEDGDASGYSQHPGNTVMGIGACFVEKSQTGGRRTVCNAGYAEHAGTACQGGDSGGPVYVPSSPAGAVYAVGIHLAGSVTGGMDTCYFQELIPALIHSGLGLLTTDGAGTLAAAWPTTDGHRDRSNGITTQPPAVPPSRSRAATRSLPCGLTARRRRLGWVADTPGRPGNTRGCASIFGVVGPQQSERPHLEGQRVAACGAEARGPGALRRSSARHNGRVFQVNNPRRSPRST